MKTNVALLIAAASFLILFHPSCANSVCRLRHLTITVEDVMEVYVDGERKFLSSAGNPDRTESVILPFWTRAIAVKCIVNEVEPGILASTEDGYILTNSSWKCTNDYFPGWETVRFDDSSWPAANQFQHKGNLTFKGIRKDASWIWKEHTGKDSHLIYCRKSIAPESCPSRTLTLTSDFYMRVYIDGMEENELPFAFYHNMTDTVDVPCHTSVIAIQGLDIVDSGGILASTADGFIVTNESWKCIDVYNPGWNQIKFDDSSWPAAHNVGPHQIPGIRSDSQWIWTESNKVRAVFCRKNLVSCPSRELNITVDDFMRLYIDGVEVPHLPNAHIWTETDTVDLPFYTSLIAVQATDNFRDAGIVASTEDDYILTNKSWKCTGVYTPGWYQTGFDDSSWPAAVIQKVPRLLTVSYDAHWIWTKTNTTRDKVVYCRKNLANTVNNEEWRPANTVNTEKERPASDFDVKAE